MHADMAVAPFVMREWPRFFVAALALVSLWPNRWVRTICAFLALARMLWGLADNLNLL
jgi:hypothetical protein